MTSPHILFTAPLGLRFIGQPPLQVVGQLDGYVAGQAYEGRLQIINNIGDCTVQWVSGTMPPGTSVRVDNDTYEVVVSWPEYAPPDPNTTVVPNGSFEAGDVNWSKGGGWLIGQGSGFDAFDGTWSAAYTGRGTASLEGTRVPVIVGTSITGSIQVQQGGSSKGNVVAGVMLLWYDAAGNLIDYDVGNIVRSGSNGAWHISTVTAAAPAGTFYVALGVTANRKRQNRRLWVDQARWNHSYASGANSDDDYCLVLLVRDSAGREALWEGCVGEQAIYYTTQPYALEVLEGIDAGLVPIDGGLRVPPQVFAVEGAEAFLSIVSGELRTPLMTFTAPPESIDTLGVTILSGELRQIQRTYQVPPEGLDVTLGIASGTLVQQLITNNMTPEGVDVSTTIVSGTLV
ncbi:tail fiber protein [Xanthomonas phage MET23-P3]|nr:tail fiber protein [Xanthomonas phage MET23-P3]